MFYRLTDDLARRLVEEIRRYWAGHPRFPDLAVQGKFSFDQRPQRGIVVKVGSANHVSLSADNYQGVLYSRAHLTTHPDKPGRFIEWVREDEQAVLANGGAMPSPAGIYWINAVEEKRGEQKQMVAYVDAMLDVEREVLSRQSPTVVRTLHPPVGGSTRLWLEPGGTPLAIPEDCSLLLGGDGHPTGEIQLKVPLKPGQGVRGDYRYYAGERPPFVLQERQANWQAIPGVVLAVGTRIEVGDVVGVVVEPVRRAAALEYGGRWELTADIDVFARDVHDQREITDATAMYLWAVLRSHLSSEGIEIQNVAMSGEGEEVYDENGDDYFYTASLSLTISTEWYLHFPLDVTIRQIFEPYSDNPDGPGDPVQIWSPGALRDPHFSSPSNPEGVH